MKSVLMCLPPTTLGDASALDAARKLRRELPSKLHLFMTDEPRPKTGAKRPVKVAGEIYPSVRSAADGQRVTAFTMLKWLESGKAVYADE